MFMWEIFSRDKQPILHLPDPVAQGEGVLDVHKGDLLQGQQPILHLPDLVARGEGVLDVHVGDLLQGQQPILHLSDPP